MMKDLKHTRYSKRYIFPPKTYLQSKSHLNAKEDLKLYFEVRK